MLIVLSDTHFAESKTNKLGDVHYNHNLPAYVFKNYFNDIASIIKNNHIKEIDIVLAGDIFEITRSGLWLEDDNLRPYVSSDLVPNTIELENKIIQILDSIALDPRVSETLEIIRSIQNQFDRKVNIYYIPGNHDRLLNSSLRIREKVRALLNLDVIEDPFPNYYVHYSDGIPFALIRHGHEYDPVNFSIDFRKALEIPLDIENEAYNKPVMGDFVTVEIAVKLPVYYRNYYTAEKILKDVQLLRLYQRLIEFDNVRPSTALLNFLFSTPGIRRQETWELLEPIFVLMLDEFLQKPYLFDFLLNIDNINPSIVKLAKLFAPLRLWRFGIPFWLIKQLMKPVSKNIKLGTVVPFVSKEAGLKTDIANVQCIITGHTHVPEVELISGEQGVQKYYINTGTWRNLIPSSSDLNQFGRLRSKAQLVIFEPGEQNPEYSRKTGWSFDFISKIGFGSEPF